MVISATEHQDFCIDSKTFHRIKDGSLYDADRSLRTVGVDVIDLYQLPDVSPQSAWDQVMQERSALEGLQIARIRGLPPASTRGPTPLPLYYFEYNYKFSECSS